MPRKPDKRRQTSDSGSGPMIKPRDQLSLLVVAASLLVLMVSYWLYRGGHRGELIHIDRAEPLQAEFLVDVNRADWPELIQLPGIGETLARRMIRERGQNGPYRSVEEVTRVNGIGLRTLDKIRPYLLPIPKDTDWAALEPEWASSVQ